MKKQSKQLLILLGVLVVLAAAFFGLKQYNKVQSEKETEAADADEIVVDEAEEDIIRLTYDYEGETYSFEKEEDTWYYTEDRSVSIAQSFIRNLVYAVAPLEAEQKIENVTDMSQYGLGDSERTIQFETAGTSYIFEIGNYNDVTDVYYISKLSENTVYAVQQGTITVFDKTLEDLIADTETESESAEETVQSQ